uniref:Uncharacterized protein n=1 Tax=Scophthalmus maximus TaxID=52904 RepID=A0A8D3CQ82_SCOMX
MQDHVIAVLDIMDAMMSASYAWLESEVGEVARGVDNTPDTEITRILDVEGFLVSAPSGLRSTSKQQLESGTRRHDSFRQINGDIGIAESFVFSDSGAGDYCLLRCQMQWPCLL